MNLLKNVIINGEINSVYASFSMQYIFSASGGQKISPHFFIPLPENSCITGFSILTGEKTIVRSEPDSYTGAALESGIKLTQTDFRTCCISWNEIPDKKEYTFSVDMLVRLFPRGDYARLHLPLGIHKTSAAPFKSGTAPFGLTLSVRNSTAAGHSVTHEMTVESYENETVFTCSGFMGSDFIFDIKDTGNTSYSIVQENISGSLGFYRIFVSNREAYIKKKKRPILMLDLTEGISDRKRSALKELFYRTMQKIPDSIETQTLAADNIEDDFYSMLKTAEAYQSADTEMILFSGGSPSNFRYAINSSLLKAVHLFTIGDFAQTEFAAYFMRKFSGIHEHFYEKDNLDRRISTGLKRILESGGEVSVTVENSSVNEVFVLSGTDAASDGYIDILASYTGVQPQIFCVRQNDAVKETAVLPPASAYRSQPDITRIFAAEKTDRLYSLLCKTSPVSMKAIKNQIEEIGIEYGILNSETVLLIKDNSSEGKAVEMFSSSNNGFTEFAERPTMLAQRDAELFLTFVEKESITGICRDILLRNIRKNGAVTDSLREKDRINDTVYAAAALCLMKDSSLASVIKDAKTYLNGKKITGFAGVLYSHTDRISDFLLLNEDMVLSALPDFEELTEGTGVLAAAQMFLRIHI